MLFFLVVGVPWLGSRRQTQDLMATPSGIQELMAAENRATQIVKDARDAKVERMKQAKLEANELVEQYKAEKETLFQQQSADNVVSEDAAALEASTQQEIQQMQENYNANKQAAISMIMGFVKTVNTEVGDP